MYPHTYALCHLTDMFTRTAYSVQERRVTSCHLSSNEAEGKRATFMQKRKLVFQGAIESHTAVINPSSPLLLKERFDD